jgi:large subunit ribosomal protein L28
LPNLVTQKFWLEGENRWVRMKVSTRGLRTIKKLGLEKALKKYGVKV